jgi:flagellin
MALIINHNMPAMIAARNLGSIYGKLGKSIERLSSGLRINSAADDAAGLAIREMMRADIATTLQGIRNAADAVSLIQTADGALAVIDARLIRMKELAEQAATGTYTAVQREIINSEFQAMADEIERIAQATNFNGIKLLDGSMSANNGGQGIRIHFGVGNDAAEDYYYINTADVRPRDAAGLNLGYDSTPDIWGTGGGNTGLDGCCGGAFASSAAIVTTTATTGFAYGYNWDANTALEGTGSGDLITFDNAGKYLAGIYGYRSAAMTVSELADRVNAGTQSRAIVSIGSLTTAGATDYAAICLGSSEMFVIGNAGQAAADIDNRNAWYFTGGTAENLATAINTYSEHYRAMWEGTSVLIFRIDPGDYDSSEIGYAGNVAGNANEVTFTNIATETSSHVGTKLSYGGEHWATMDVIPATGDSVNVTLTGQNAGDPYELKIVTADDATTFFAAYVTGGAAFATNSKLSEMPQIQDAADGRGTVRTQEAAQRALVDINDAIVRKDQIRAHLGATQNRLEATIDNLTIQAENLQAAESRISDVDVATEMTEFTKNNILAQAATSMLAQANSLSTLALTLLMN